MAVKTKNALRSGRGNPLRGFKFRIIDLDDGEFVAGYNKITGLKSNVEPVEYREGNDDNYVQKMTGLANHDDVILDKGFSNNEYMRQWFEKCMSWEANGPTSDEPEQYYKDLVIQIMDRMGNIIREYELFNCFPNAYEIDDLDARTSDAIMERVTLSVEGSKMRLGSGA